MSTMQVMHTRFENLACAVIKQAVVDANDTASSDPKDVDIHEDGREFILSRRLDDYINVCHLDLNSDYIRRSIQRR